METSGQPHVENFLDMAHFSFIHEGLPGAANRAEFVDYKFAPFDDGEGGKGLNN